MNLPAGVPPLTSSLKRRLIREHAEVKATHPFIAAGFAWCDRCNTAIESSPRARAFHERRCERLLNRQMQFSQSEK